MVGRLVLPLAILLFALQICSFQFLVEKWRRRKLQSTVHSTLCLPTELKTLLHLGVYHKDFSPGCWPRSESAYIESPCQRRATRPLLRAERPEHTSVEDLKYLQRGDDRWKTCQLAHGGVVSLEPVKG
ncbi:hypothetical protein BDW66DRAFT_90348 [Aspergillus desertorum]